MKQFALQRLAGFALLSAGLVGGAMVGYWWGFEREERWEKMAMEKFAADWQRELDKTAAAHTQEIQLLESQRQANLQRVREELETAIAPLRAEAKRLPAKTQ